MHKDDVVANIIIDGDSVFVVEREVKVCNQFLGRRLATYDIVMEELENRCFSRYRSDVNELLKAIGLSEYNPLDIVRVTHGVLLKDMNWVRFKGEELTWNKVKPLSYR